MRILLVTGYFPPEGGSGSRLAGELAGFLASAGHAVTVLAPTPNYYVDTRTVQGQQGGLGRHPDGHAGPPSFAEPSASLLHPIGDVGSTSVSDPPVFAAGDVQVVRAGFPVPRFLPHKAARGIEHLVRPFTLLPAGLRLPRPDVVYGFSLQPAGVVAATGLARWFRRSATDCRNAARDESRGAGSSLRRTPCEEDVFPAERYRRSCATPRLFFHIEDLFPDNAVDTGIISRGPVSGLLSAGMGVLLRHADRVFVHAPGLVSRLAERGIAAQAIPNWVDYGRLGAGTSETRHRLFPGSRGRCVALFAGILGLAQGMDDLLGVAEATRGRDDLELAVVGDGPLKTRFAGQVRERGLSHVRLMPLVPPSDYPGLVAACDIFLVLLSHRVRYPVIPSRIGDGLAAGRPLLAALPDGDAADLVRASGGGLVVPPGHPERLAVELVRLAGDPKLRQRLGGTGQAYAQRHLDLPVVLGRLEQEIVPGCLP